MKVAGEQAHRRVVLRDGREAMIRRVRPEDAPALVEAWVAMARDGRGMVATEAEMTLERAEKSIARFGPGGERGGDKGLFLVGEVDGRAVADASVSRMGAARVRHVATLGVGVAPAFQGLGLGRAMMESVIAWAGGAGIERLDLCVRGDNDRAMALYESLGFERESLRPCYVRLEVGTYVDDWVMVRRVSDAR